MELTPVFTRRIIIGFFLLSGMINPLFAGHDQDHGHQDSHGKDSIHTHGGDAHHTEHATHGEEESEFNATEVIMHHVVDAHDWHIADWDGHAISVPLPVILWTDNGLVSFMSSEFHHDDHGHHVVEKGGQRFVKFHNHIYYANESADSHHLYVTMDEEGKVLNAQPLDFSITKNAASIMLSFFLCLILFIGAARAYKKSQVPGGIARLIEPLIVFIRDEVALPNIGQKKYERFVPYLLTLFFFIWINNMLGLIPFFPGGANTTGNIAVTMVLAVLTLLIVNFNGNKHYWQHIFWMPGVPVPVRLMLAPIELVGILTKPFALMIRLFANMTAGHIVILSLISLIFIFKTEWMSIASVPLTLFIFLIKVLVALLQAYIFALLTALFIGQAVEEHEHH